MIKSISKIIIPLVFSFFVVSNSGVALAYKSDDKLSQQQTCNMSSEQKEKMIELKERELLIKQSLKDTKSTSLTQNVQNQVLVMNRESLLDMIEKSKLESLPEQDFPTLEENLVT